ncbi:MAG: hypothetical protein ACOC56_02985 [Atribacterota bacterium]
MKKDKDRPMKVSKYTRDFIENTRSTRRSSIIGTDEKMLTQSQTFDLVTYYFKKNPERYKELIKLKMEKKND